MMDGKICPSPLNVVSENIIKDFFFSWLTSKYLAGALLALYQMNMLGG